MSAESAEMTKHAVNAFLATSVVFINEIAAACEATGADAKEVERGLKSEARIGPGAYLGPGAAFAGGTLARDVAFLLGIGERLGFATPLLAGVKQSNDVHRGVGPPPARRAARPARRQDHRRPGPHLQGRTPIRSGARSRWRSVAGASSRGRSCARTIRRSARRRPELPEPLMLVRHVDDAIRGADAIVVATEWPAFRALTRRRASPSGRRGPLVLDANRFLAGGLAADARDPLRCRRDGQEEHDEHMKLQGKKILITGASQGLGLAVAERCLAEGRRRRGLRAHARDRSKRVGAALRARGRAKCAAGDGGGRGRFERRRGRGAGGRRARASSAGSTAWSTTPASTVPRG